MPASAHASRRRERAGTDVPTAMMAASAPPEANELGHVREPADDGHAHDLLGPARGIVVDDRDRGAALRRREDVDHLHRAEPGADQDDAREALDARQRGRELHFDGRGGRGRGLDDPDRDQPAAGERGEVDAELLGALACRSRGAGPGLGGLGEPPRFLGRIVLERRQIGEDPRDRLSERHLSAFAHEVQQKPAVRAGNVDDRLARLDLRERVAF